MQSALDNGLAYTAGVDEALLVSRLRAGDERAFEDLVRTFGGRLLAVARRFVRNDEDAQDIVQSAYLSAFRALDQFEGNCQLSTWLHRIVVNTALMKLRSRSGEAGGVHRGSAALVPGRWAPRRAIRRLEHAGGPAD